MKPTLTSLNDKDLRLIGYSKSVKNLVTHQAKLAKKAIDALVCSPYEVGVKKIFKKEIITPGVQIGKEIMIKKDPWKLKKLNLDWLVIGRAITARGKIKKISKILLKS